jgi:hypothetical protein
MIKFTFSGDLSFLNCGQSVVGRKDRAGIPGGGLL